MTKEREFFIPTGKGISNVVFVDGEPCVPKFINPKNVSRLESSTGKSLSFTGGELKAIIAKDERNHQYYKDKPPEPPPTVTPPAPIPPPASSSPPPLRFETIDYYTLMQQKFAPLKYAVEEILPQGLFILAGAPKIGKSWLTLDMCRAIATGEALWDFGTTKGDVLYVALEDTHRRLQDRMFKIEQKTIDIQAELADKSKTRSFHFTTISKGLFGGMAEQIDTFVSEHPNTNFIAIDTLEHIRRSDKQNDNRKQERGLYATDYNDMQMLRNIVNKYDGMTIMLIHHTRKMYDSDPLHTVTGSTGLTGAVDGIWVLDKDKRSGDTAILSIANRDTKGYSFKLQLDEDSCKWQYLGECEDEEKSDKEMLATAINNLFTATDITSTEEWKGNATALCTALHKINDTLPITDRSIKGKISNKDFLDWLKRKFCISYKYQEFGRTIILSHLLRFTASVRGVQLK